MDDRTVGCDLPSMSEDVKIAEMTRLRSRLKRAKAAGLIDYQAVSLALSGKRNKTYIQQFITKESPRVMQDFLVKEVEAYLDSAEKGTLPPQSPSAGGIDLVRIPDLAIFGGMGSGGELDVYTRAGALLDPEQVRGYWSLPEYMTRGFGPLKNIYVWEVRGDSMEPTLPGHSVVFVDVSQNHLPPDDIYAVNYGEGLLVKRIKLIPRTDRLLVMSDNERYGSDEMNRDDVRVWGRVVAWFQWRG